MANILKKELFLKNIKFDSLLKKIIKKLKNKKKIRIIREFWQKNLCGYLKNLISLEQMINTKEIEEKKIFNRISMLNNNILKRADVLEKKIGDAQLIEKIKENFRIACGPWAYRSKIVKHAFIKPYGYPGDYELLELIYNNKPISEGIGYYLDLYFLNDPYAKAVRERKNKMRSMLINYIRRSGKRRIDILNIACGSTREWKEIIDTNPSIFKNKKIVLSLVDYDKQALEFSKNHLRGVKNIKLRSFRHNVLWYTIRSKKYKSYLNRQDIIYTIGLADYLPDKFLKKLINFLYSLLKKNGRLIIAHKDIDKYKPLPPDWWCNWRFIPRNQNKFLNLIKESDIYNFRISIQRIPRKIIFFIILQKK